MKRKPVKKKNPVKKEKARKIEKIQQNIDKKSAKRENSLQKRKNDSK